MATSSFDKAFVVKDKAAIKKFKEDARSPVKVVIKQRDYKSDNAKGIKLLKQRLSVSGNC